MNFEVHTLIKLLEKVPKAIYPDTHVVEGIGTVPLADSGGQTGPWLAQRAGL